MKLLIVIVFIISLNLNTIRCESICEDLLTCSECVLSLIDDCQWCPAENYSGKRCTSKLQNENTCETAVSKPKIKSKIVRNDLWTTGGSNEKIVQFQPQYVEVKSASPGVPVHIPISYKPAQDAPLDVYFAIDNSKSIKKYKDDLKNSSELIIDKLKIYTNNVKLGFGTFIEKPVLPYADPDIHNVYSFKNDLPLTDDMSLLKSTLDNLVIGSNYDLPENVLDALMQVMLCKKSIGWRENARKVIVVFTNAFYHAAGDGKMLGAFKRHDMKCHEGDNMDTIMDYPSVGQVNKVAKQDGFVIIFAVLDEKLKEHYRILSEKIDGSKYVSLTKHPIDEMIKNEYIKIIEKVDIKHNSPPYIQVTTKKVCSDCKAMHYKPLELVTTLKVVSCPENPLEHKTIIKIGPTSLNETLTVEIELNCQCDCEKDTLTDFNSLKCNQMGHYQCGICKCNQNRSGDTCKCERDSMNSSDDYVKCKKNPNHTLLCSGHGECSCGKCETCHKGFSGPFCEYNDKSCLRRNGKLCSGHGECTMGRCVCDPYWTHSPGGAKDCGCSIEEKSCIAPYSSKVCSGNGECRCGTCVCNSISNYNETCRGRYCDNCKWFAEKRCKELEEFAYCSFLNKSNCVDNYNLTNIEVVFANRSAINSPDNPQWYSANWCRFKEGEDESILVFKYFYNTDEDADQLKLNVVIQNELDETPPANIWGMCSSEDD